MYVSARDMSAWKDAVEKLRQAKTDADAASSAKSRFLANMSHEIRTPMNSILGYSQLMLRDPALGLDAKANLRIMSRSGEHLLTLINSILDMSKIEAGQTELCPTTFSLPALLEGLENMFRARAEPKGLLLEVVLDGGGLNYVVADEGKVRQVLINLLGNAIKFTDQGRITLRATLERRSADRFCFSACVEDTGSGLTAEDQSKLFRPFTQLNARLNTKEGTGLGLAISREYARLMGGDLTVLSQAGKGSTFLVQIPMEMADSRVFTKSQVNRQITGIQSGYVPPKILVVDDQFENRDWLVKLLTVLGFQVESAENGAEAVHKWEAWKPQMVLMDIHMPVMDGLEATRRIKAAPGGEETVIIALTASVMNDQRKTAVHSGVDGFLGKPFSQNDLLGKIQGHLNIAYDYEDAEEAQSQLPAGTSALSPEALSQLPAGLVEELRVATLKGKKRSIDGLILKVRAAGHIGSALALQNLADNYDYVALTHALQAALPR